MPFRLPSLRDLVRHALPHLVEGTIAPIALFYAGYTLAGLWGGLAGALVWAYGALAVRLLRGLPVPGLLVLSLLALTARSAAALATGSVFVYFLQPTLATFLTAGAFVTSAVLGRPLTERLSADLVQLPDAVREHPAVRRLHVVLTLLWAGVFTANGAVALWLLVNRSVGTFLLAKSVLNGAVVLAAIAVSTHLFLRCVRRHAVAAPLAVAGPAAP